MDLVSEAFSLSAVSESTATVAAPSFIEKLAADDSAFMQVISPYFAPVGEMVRALSKDAQETWFRLAVGDGTLEKVFAIFLGYAVDIVLLALYLNVLTVGSMKNAGRAVRSAIRQQLVVIKVRYTIDMCQYASG